MTILMLLSNSDSITYSKTLAQKIGIDETILFGALCGKCEELKAADSYFYYQQSRIEKDTTLPESRIRKACKKLTDLGLIYFKKIGAPAKYHYRINENELLNLLEIELICQKKKRPEVINHDFKKSGNETSRSHKIELQNKDININNNNPLTPLKGGVENTAEGTERVAEANLTKEKEVTAKPQAITNERSNCYTKKKADCFEQFSKAYLAKRRNKAESKKHYYAYLNGSKRDRTDGTLYRYNHVQLFLAAERYMGECYEKNIEPEKIKLMSTFLNERIRDYVEKTRQGYEAMMRERYGDEWERVRFRYE